MFPVVMPKATKLNKTEYVSRVRRCIFCIVFYSVV